MTHISVRVVTLTCLVLLTACRNATPTFNADVAPIVFKNCAPCHRTGNRAVPFTLLSYDDAKNRADSIAGVTLDRRMPPWPPDPVTPGFVGERHLTAEQIDIIQRWVKGGATEGHPATRPAEPQFPHEWESGQPDVIVTMERPYTLEPRHAVHHDVFRNVVMRVPIKTAKFVKTVEFVPGVAPVHHAVIRIDRTGQSRRDDGKDGKPGFDGMASLDVQNPDGHFIGWAPGRGPIVAPPGMPWRLDPGTDLVIELHLLPGAEPIEVAPQLGLFLTDEPPARIPIMVIMGSRAIDIPAGEKDYSITDSYVLPGDTELLSVYPHAHYLGKDIRVDAKLPDGTSRTLLHIARWSFHWQQDYRYLSSVFLPRGTTISMRFTYDNSDENAQNPHHPPVRVTFGGNSSDEMGNLALQLLPRVPTDGAIIVRDFARKEALANVEGDEVLAKYDPNNAYSDLGGALAQAGRSREAVEHLRRALAIDPTNDAARRNLSILERLPIR